MTQDSKTDSGTSARNMKKVMQPSSSRGQAKPKLYLATDEKDHKFFAELHKTFEVFQINDFFEVRADTSCFTRLALCWFALAAVAAFRFSLI